MKKIMSGCVLLILLAGLLSGCTPNRVKTIVADSEPSKKLLIAGSGSNFIITSELIQQFNKQYKQTIQIPNSVGSAGGIKAAGEGAIHLGLTSRRVNDTEKKLGLKEIPYARIGIVLGVSQDVPDVGITSKDLVNIYFGSKNKWHNGKPIVVLSREKGDSTNLVLEKLIPGFQEALADAFQNQRWQIIYTDQEETDAITSTPASLGFTDTAVLAVKHLPIKPLQVDGVEPTINNVSRGRYKLYKDLYFVYKDPLPEDVQAFLDFVYSDQGQRIISKSGGIPIKGK